MAFAQRGTEWLLFPGAAFHLLGGNMYTVTGMQMPQLFPSRKNTLGTLMSGVCGMSTFTFVLVKIAYDNHISHKASLLCLAGVSFVISTVTTIVLPPREKKGRDNDKEKLQKELDYVPSSLADHKKHTIDRNGPVFVVALTCKNHEETKASGIHDGVADNKKTESNGEITEKGEGSTIIGELARQNSTVELLSKDSFASLEAVAVSSPADRTGHTKTFGDILRSPIFWMTEIWFVCNVLLGVAYFGGFNAMVVFRNTGESHRTISLYTDVFGYLQLAGGIPLALLTGFLIERSSRKQSSVAKEAEPKAFLFSFLVTSTAGLLVWVSCVIPVLEMQFTAMAFHCILGTFTYATHIAFIAFA
ncbi:uncharacterized protein LOC106165888 [Lingula anatina]|uniref:Uncharacterized protein LOC106165888 n=1 Tax=Lingula anatina TaxID=7574 RepID=A0A1S3IP73_LINAN|nr:uncharacterized protein LOC106165888 [Lingula anatina]|eukprot:XP_013399706.1 uncharacterized protein LOC106165888 [Lingula anatina]